MIESLERRNWATGIAIFAVVVILKNPGARPRGPFEKRHTAAYRHHRTQRKLMRGGNVDEFRTTASAFRLQGVEPVSVNGNRHDLGRECSEHRRDDRETRVLDADGVIGIQQHTDCEIQTVLDSRHDNDLISRALYSARLPKIVGNCLSQWPIATAIAVREQSS